MQGIFSKVTTDTETPDLFEEIEEVDKTEEDKQDSVFQPKPIEKVPEVDLTPASKQVPIPKKESKVEKKPSAPEKKQGESSGSRKSTQDYQHEESVEGLRDKYVNTSQGVDGFDDSIYLPNGEEVSGIWKLVDAFSVSPSHDPFTFHSTKGFPKASGGGSANTRDYSNESSAQEQVIEVAGDFDGRALGFDSAVVVTKDGVVVSGNNRTMSSQLAARKGTDTKYIQALLKRCRSFGFTQEQVQAFEHPRVVFEIDSQDYSSEHFDKYNQSDKKEQTEEARIVKFSKITKPEVLRGIADVFGRFETGNVFAIREACAELISVFVKGGVISKAEEPKYFDGDKVSTSGKQFINEYILGGVLSESVARALYAEGAGNIRQNVIGSAPLLLENWANGSYSVVGELNKAIGYALSFQKDIEKEKFSIPKIDKEKVKTPEDKLAHNLKAFNVWASQGDLLEDRDPVILKLAGSLVFSGPLFKSYLEKLNSATASAARAERETEEAGNAGLFGDDAAGPNRSDLLERAVASWNRRAGIKRNILSSVVMGDSMDELIGSGVLNKLANFMGADLKSRIEKWMDEDPRNENAFKLATRKHKENWGAPKTRDDALRIFKRAKRLAQQGDQSFDQGQETQTKTQGQSGSTSFQGGPGSSVPADDPVKLFKAIKTLYKGGQISKDQLNKAFQMVAAGYSKVTSGVFERDGREFYRDTCSICGEPIEVEVWQGKPGEGPDDGLVWDALGGNPRHRQCQEDKLRKDKEQQEWRREHNAYKGVWGPGTTKDFFEEGTKKVTSSTKNPGVRFSPLGDKKSLQGYQVGSRVVYKPYKLSSSVPAFVLQQESLHSGKEGVIRSIKSELFNVEMPDDGEIISAYADELEPVYNEDITSGRGAVQDPTRDSVRDFLSNIVSLSKVPEDAKDPRIVKERLEPDHVCYWYSETIDNGKPYTVEFHVSPDESFCDIYVVRDFDNSPLEPGGFSIEDFANWNLSDVNHIEGLFAKEKATTEKTAEGKSTFNKRLGEKQDLSKYKYAPFPGASGHKYSQGELFASFDKWVHKVDQDLSSGRSMGLEDMAIVSRLALDLAKRGYLKSRFYLDDLDHKALSYIDRYYSGEFDLERLHSLMRKIYPDLKTAFKRFGELDDFYRSSQGKAYFEQQVVASAADDPWHYRPGDNERGITPWQESEDNFEDVRVRVAWQDGSGDVDEGWVYYYDPNEAYHTVHLDNGEVLKNFQEGLEFEIIGSSALDLYRKTLNTANKLTKNPMGVVDDLAELPFKAVDKVTGVKSGYHYEVLSPEGKVVNILMKEPSEEELLRDYGEGFTIERQGVHPDIEEMTREAERFQGPGGPGNGNYGYGWKTDVTEDLWRERQGGVKSAYSELPRTYNWEELTSILKDYQMGHVERDSVVSRLMSQGLREDVVNSLIQKASQYSGGDINSEWVYKWVSEIGSSLSVKSSVGESDKEKEIFNFLNNVYDGHERDNFKWGFPSGESLVDLLVNEYGIGEEIAASYVRRWILERRPLHLGSSLGFKEPIADGQIKSYTDLFSGSSSYIVSAKVFDKALNYLVLKFKERYGGKVLLKLLSADYVEDGLWRTTVSLLGKPGSVRQKAQEMVLFIRVKHDGSYDIWRE